MSVKRIFFTKSNYALLIIFMFVVRHPSVCKFFQAFDLLMVEALLNVVRHHRLALIAPLICW